MGACRIFSREGANPETSQGLKDVPVLCLLMENQNLQLYCTLEKRDWRCLCGEKRLTVSLWRKETDGVSVSDSVHGSVLQKIEKQNSEGCKCTTLHLPAGALVGR